MRPLSELLALMLWVLFFLAVVISLAAIMVISGARNAIEQLWLNISKGPPSKPPKLQEKMQNCQRTPWRPSGKSRSDTGQ